jgi:hypothetical protein
VHGTGLADTKENVLRREIEIARTSDVEKRILFDFLPTRELTLPDLLRMSDRLI